MAKEKAAEKKDILVITPEDIANADTKQKKKILKKLKEQNRGPNALTRSQQRLLAIVVFMTMGIFMPTAILIIVGMLPTFVAFFVQKKEVRIRVMTIGAMNVAGVTPFLLELWVTGHSFQNGFSILFSPRTIITMYFCAGLGYVIDWFVTNFVSSILFERGEKRKAEMLKEQEALVERWGEKVTGRFELDGDGFPFKD